MTNRTRKTTNYLRLYRKKNGLSQKQIAYLMGYKSSNSISHYERGYKFPQLINLLKLEIIHRTPIAFLFKDQYLALKKEIRQREITLLKLKRSKNGKEKGQS